MMLNAYNLTIWRHWHHVIVLYLCYPVLSCFIVLCLEIVQPEKSSDFQHRCSQATPEPRPWPVQVCSILRTISHQFNKKSEEFDQNHSEFRICEFLSRHLWHLWHLWHLAVPGSSQRMWSIGKTWQHYDHDHCNSWPNRDLVAQWCLTLQNTITTKPYRKLVTPCNTSVTPNNIQQLFKSMFVYSCGPVLLWERPHRMFFLGCFFCPAWLKRSNCLPGKAEKTGQPGFEGARKWMQIMGCKTPLFLQVVGKHIRSVWRMKNSMLCALQPVAPSIQFPGKRGRKPIQLRGLPFQLPCLLPQLSLAHQSSKKQSLSANSSKNSEDSRCSDHTKPSWLLPFETKNKQPQIWNTIPAVRAANWYPTS